jgi:hypothetical protein
MTLETREEEEMLAKVRALDPAAIWAVKGTVQAIEAAVKALSAKFDTLEAAIKSIPVPQPPVVETPVARPWDKQTR